MKYTTDLWLASYLIGLGHPIVEVRREGKKVSLGFSLSSEQWNQYKISWLNSDEIKIKYTIEKIKDLIFQE